MPGAMQASLDAADPSEQPDDPQRRVERFRNSRLSAGVVLRQASGRSSLDILADDRLDVQLAAG